MKQKFLAAVGNLLVAISGAVMSLLLTSGVVAQTGSSADTPSAEGLSLGRLGWRMSAEELRAAAADPQHRLHATLEKLLKNLPTDLANTPSLDAPAAFEHEGKLASDPAYAAFNKYHREISVVLRLAVASKVGESVQMQQAGKVGGDYLIKWVKSFHFSGSAMTEVDFLFVFAAADLLIPSLDLEDKIALANWLRACIAASDKTFESWPDDHSIRVNNVNTWRLALRGMAAEILGEPQLIAENRELITDQMTWNLRPHPKWNPNPDMEKSWASADFGSYDFRHRDAMHYHAGTLEAWTWIATMIPGQMTPEVRSEVLRAHEFMRAYYTGEKKHQEFLNSRVGFDKRRAEAGQSGFEGDWNPETANKGLLMARASFPEIRPWTAAVLEGKYDIWRELIAGIQWLPSEVERREIN